jgi:hypothetical protein
MLKIPAFSGWSGGGRAWTAEEIALLGTDTDEAVAKRIGRTPGAVAQRRAKHRRVPHVGATITGADRNRSKRLYAPAY